MIPFSASQEDDTRFSFVCVARYLHLFQLHKSLQQPQNAEGNTLPCCFTLLRVWLCSLLMMHLPSSCNTASGVHPLPPAPHPSLLFWETLSLCQVCLAATSPKPLPAMLAKTFPRRTRRKRALKVPRGSFLNSRYLIL